LGSHCISNTSENINKQSLYIRRKEKIALSLAFVFAYLHSFVYIRERVNASSFFSLLILITSSVRCLSDIKNTLSIGPFYLIFCLFFIKINGRWFMHQWSLQLMRDKSIYISYFSLFFVFIYIHNYSFQRFSSTTLILRHNLLVTITILFLFDLSYWNNIFS
jgi:hypothetical protein